MAEAPPTGASLTVLGGPYAGTSVVVDDSVEEILIGSDPGCPLTLDLPGVSPVHARARMDGGELLVSDTRSARGVYVNDARVTDQTPLRDGDILWLGPPGDPDSVMLQCRLDPALGAAVAGDDFFFGDAVASEPAPPTGGAEHLLATPVSDDDVLFGDVLADAVPAEPAPQDFFLEDVPPADVPVGSAVGHEEPLFDAPDELAAPISFAPAPELEMPVEEGDALGSDAFFVDEPEAGAPVIPEDEIALPVPAAPPVAAPAPAPPAQAAAPAARAPILPPAATPSPAIIDDTRFADPASAMSSTAPRSAPAPRGAGTPPAGARKAGGATSASRPAPARKAGIAVPRVAVIGVAAALLLGVAVFFGLRMLRAPRVVSTQPARVSVGQGVTLTGQHFSMEAAENGVRFGTTPAKVVSASATTLNVEVPELPVTPGKDLSVPIVVTVNGRESSAIQLAVFRSPRIHGVSPNVAMPGDEIVLAGTGFGPGAKVKFAGVDGEAQDIASGSMRVKVPALDVGTGKELPVTVLMGKDTSNPMPFVVGHLPLVTKVEPATAAAGDVVVVSGRGFQAVPAANKVQIGGVPALVAGGSTTELQVVVPRGAGTGGLELRVAGLANVGQAALAVTPSPDPIEFRFVAEPFVDDAGHEHALLASGLGPAFVLSAAGGKSAAQRALEAERRLNQAAGALRASLDASIASRTLDTAPAIGLVGSSEALLEATGEDAEAYNEDWTHQRKGPAVTRARLAVWWEAVARDLVLLLIRGEKPEHTAALTPEGRVLADLFQAARQTVGVGVPVAQLAAAKPAQRDAIRVLGLRVPASVPGAAGADTAGSASDSAPPLKLDGPWSGTQNLGDGITYITVTINKGAGQLTYQRALTLTVPILGVEQGRGGVVRFHLQTGGGGHFYTGRWDGKQITGTVSSDAAGKAAVGTFELASSR